MKIKKLGRVDYLECWQAMQDFTAARQADTEDEIWLLQHPPVYTQGIGGKAEHILRRNDIPILPIDRGGQITYHGPGQAVMYVLWDIKRMGLGVRQLVSILEEASIALLAEYGIAAEALPQAPGVYVRGQKIASLGLKIRHGCSYHGLALNVDMDLQPFRDINPCGLSGMTMTQLRNVGVPLTVDEAGEALLRHGLEALRRRLPSGQ